MTTLVVETTEGVGLPLEVAGAGSRALAALVDLCLCGCAMVMVTLVSLVAASADPTGFSQFAAGVVLGAGLLLLVVYYAAFTALWDGRTPGKALLGLRVRDTQGHPARLSQVLLRSLFLLVEILPLPVPIGFAILASSARRQRLGDVVADTLVLRDPPAGPGLPPALVPRMERPEHAAQPPERALVLTPASVAHLRPADRELLRAFQACLAREGLDPEARRLRTRDVGRHFAERLGIAAPRGEAATLALLQSLFLYVGERR